MNYLEKILNLFVSPRFITFYWLTGISTSVSFITLISENIPDLGLPEWVALLVVSGLSQLTKALSNYKQGKPMGFAK